MGGLTERAEAVVDGDHDNPPVGGEHGAVVERARAPAEALAVEVDQHGVHLRAGDHWGIRRVLGERGGGAT